MFRFSNIQANIGWFCSNWFFNSNGLVVFKRFLIGKNDAVSCATLSSTVFWRARKYALTGQNRKLTSRKSRDASKWLSGHRNACITHGGQHDVVVSTLYKQSKEDACNPTVILCVLSLLNMGSVCLKKNYNFYLQKQGKDHILSVPPSSFAAVTAGVCFELSVGSEERREERDELVRSDWWVGGGEGQR